MTEKELERTIRYIKSAEPLNCDVCGGYLCHCDASDLNGSYFFCGKCFAAHGGAK